MAKEDGSFIVSSLCETVVGAGEEGADVRKTLKGWFGKDVRKELEKERERRGVSTLLTQISAL